MDPENPFSPSAPPLPPIAPSYSRLLPVTSSVPPPQRQRPRFCSLLCMVVYVTVMIFLCASLGLYVSKPVTLISPEIKLQSITATSPLTLTDIGPDYSFDGALNLTFTIGNPGIGDMYGLGNFSIYYDNAMQKSEFLLASTPLESFCLERECPKRNDFVSWRSYNVVANATYVPADLTAFALGHDLEDGRLGLTVELTADYRTDENIPSNLRVTCKGIQVEVPTGVMLGDPKRCKVDWDDNKWFFSLPKFYK